MCKRRFPCTSQSSGQQLRSIRHSVPATTFQTLIVFLVLSMSDYGNAVLTGLPVYLFRRLQSVMNAAARLIYGLRHSDHISDALISLHWLRAQELRRPCSCTSPLMEPRRHTRVNWFVSPIFLVGVPSALLGPIVCWYRP